MHRTVQLVTVGETTQIYHKSMTPNQSLKFIKEVCMENGMPNYSDVSLEQFSNFLNSIGSPKVKRSPNKRDQRDPKTIKDDQIKHFKLRFLQRVGFILNDNNYKILCDLTKTTGTFLGKHDKCINSIFSVSYNGIKMRVVYNPFENILVTVLP